MFFGKRISCVLATDVCLEPIEEGSKQNAVLRDLLKCIVSNSFFPEKDVCVTVFLPIILISAA